jgi:hypothetical protein
MLPVTLELSRKMEMAEGRANAAFEDARACLQPGYGAEWAEFSGTLAMFDGPDSPVTQTLGLGLHGTVREADLDMLERFFRDRGAAVNHEVSPIADASLWPLLHARRYEPVEFTTVLFQELPLAPKVHSTEVEVHIATEGELDAFADTSAEAWSAELPEFAGMARDFARVSAAVEGGFPFLARLGGMPVATAMLRIDGDIAQLAGGATLPAFRRRGAQGALLDARLRFAADQGCRLAIMGAQPGSTSQVNAQRNGFHIAYTRIKWRLAP